VKATAKGPFSYKAYFIEAHLVSPLPLILVYESTPTINLLSSTSQSPLSPSAPDV